MTTMMMMMKAHSAMVVGVGQGEALKVTNLAVVVPVVVLEVALGLALGLQQLEQSRVQAGEAAPWRHARMHPELRRRRWRCWT